MQEQACIATATEIQLSDAVAVTMASILAPNMHFAKTGSYSVVEPASPRSACTRDGRRLRGPQAPAAPGSTVKQMKKDGKPADEIQKAKNSSD